MRVGWGFDAHRLGGEPPIVLGGVLVSPDRGVLATSDGDVVAHAVADAMLGAAALGDIGDYFPSSDPAFAGADSMVLASKVLGRVGDAGFAVESIDVTVIAESIRVAPMRADIRESLARLLNISAGQVSVKATTTDGMGFLGQDQGIAATALVVLRTLD